MAFLHSIGGLLIKGASASAGCCALMLCTIGPAIADADEDLVWLNGLRAAYFGDRPIIENDEIVELDAPTRAEFAAIVPISVRAKIPQTTSRFIKTITLLIDKNPSPLVGRFHFEPNAGRADLALRVRVNDYTPVRAVAETNDGKLYMSRRFVKASGGCSAPVGTNLEAMMARLGKIKLRTRGEVRAEHPVLAQLMISHPNLTGLQMDQVTRLYAPAHFVKEVRVSFDGEPVFSAETDISVSENPNFQFYFVPIDEGELDVEVVDSEGLRFNHTQTVSPAT